MSYLERHESLGNILDECLVKGYMELKHATVQEAVRTRLQLYRYKARHKQITEDKSYDRIKLKLKGDFTLILELKP